MTGMTTPPTVDQAKAEAFMGQAVGDLAGTMATLMCALGDHLGLFKDLAAHGPATSAELAARTGIHERYAREWLSLLASAGYLAYDPAAGRFALPAEHVVPLAQEGGPGFLGGTYQWVLAVLGIFPRYAEAFRTGRGIPAADFPPMIWDAIERVSAAFCFEHGLVQRWLPALPEVRARLERGATLADVGCGRGRALLKLAQAFPAARFVGYDAFAPTIAAATERAAAAGVGDRVRFAHRDVAEGLPERYDVVTAFDVLHDAARPLELLRAIRQGLKEDGVFLCLEAASSERLEENAGPVGTMNYGFSVLYCLSVSLGEGGPGLGTYGLPEPRLRALCAEAGFGSVARAPVEVPFQALYAIRP